MNLKEEVEKALQAETQRQIQERQQILTAEQARVQAEKLRANNFTERKASLQPEFDRLTKEHFENVRFVTHIVVQAKSYLSPKLKELQNRVVNRYPVVQLKLPKEPYFPSEPTWNLNQDGPYIQQSPINTLIDFNLTWGQTLWREYHRFKLKNLEVIPMKEVDYSEISGEIKFLNDDMLHFGVIGIRGEEAIFLPFHDWRNNPALITDALNEAFKHPEIHKYKMDNYQEDPPNN